MNLKLVHTSCFLGLFLVGMSHLCLSQLNVVSTGVDYVIDFDNTVANVNQGAYNGSGLQPSPASGQLDSDAWQIIGYSDGPAYYGGTYTTPNSDFNRTGPTSSTNITQASLYAFEGTIINGRALGIVISNAEMTPGSIELKCTNNTGFYLDSVILSYNLYVRNWTNNSTNTDRVNSLNGSLKIDGFGEYTSFSQDTISPSDLMYNSPGERTNSDLILVPQSDTLSGIVIHPDSAFYFRWDTDVETGAGEHDEFAIDDLRITVYGKDSLIFYTRNTGSQSSSATAAGTTIEWSSLPAGNVQYRLGPYQDSATHVIQDNHTMTLAAGGPNFTIKNLVVESLGRLQGNGDGSSVNANYLSLHEDILCHGEIGYSSGANSNIGFNLMPGSHLISGNGNLNCSRIRKESNGIGICNLTFDMDATLHWSATGMYNNRDAIDGGDNLFNITVSSGNLVDVNGNLAIDGTNPAIGSGHNAGGHITVDGTLTVGSRFFATNNNINPLVTSSLTINDGGVVNVKEISAEASGTAGHTLTVNGGGLLNITGAGAGNAAWPNFSLTNNTIDLQPGSIVEYSRTGVQVLPDSLFAYRNLVLSGSGNKTFSQGVATEDLRIHEDLNIEGGAVLQTSGEDIHISGSWTSWGAGGFYDPGVSVTFDNASGNASINSTGTEIFDHLIFNGDTVTFNTDVSVVDDLDLFSRVDLNSNEIIIEKPINTTISNGIGYFISEDSGHQGRVTAVIDNYSLPVEFPFGASDGTPIYCRIDLNSGNVGTVSMATYPTDDANTILPVSPVPVVNLNSVNGLTPDNRYATADRFWSITATGSTFDVNLELGLTIEDVNGNADIGAVTGLIAQRYDTSTDKWDLPLGGQSVLTSVFGNPNSLRVIIPGVTQFSPWAIAGSGNPLPVELLSFSGTAKEDGIQLQWSTASEVNNSHFEIRRFSSELEETWLGEMAGNGNSSSQSDYEFLDKSPLHGWNYYRLIQHDFDGTVSDEGLLSVLWEGSSNIELLMAQWTDAGLLIQLSESSIPCDISLYDSSGRVIYTGSASETRLIIPVAVSQGLFVLKVEKDDQVIVKKLSKFRP